MMTGSDIDRHMNLSNMRPKLKQHILDLYQERRQKLATMTMSATKQRKRAQRLTDGANETKFDEADVETEQVEKDAVIKCVGQQVLDLVVDPHRPRLTPPRAASPSDTWCSVARPTAPCPPCPSPSSSTRWTAVDRAPMPRCLWHPWRWSSCLPSSPQSRPA